MGYNDCFSPPLAPTVIVPSQPNSCLCLTLPTTLDRSHNISIHQGQCFPAQEHLPLSRLLPKAGRLTDYAVTHAANSRNEKETKQKPFMSDVGPTLQVILHIVCTSWSTMCITAVSTVQVCSCGLCVQAVKRHRCVRWFCLQTDVRDSLHFIELAPTRRPLVRLGDRAGGARGHERLYSDTHSDVMALRTSPKRKAWAGRLEEVQRSMLLGAPCRCPYESVNSSV